ncbi:hypothetical protein [Frondihabitans australicus]|uniref:Uncharacterized protein n=1 Tax=Frondihabitans australicus TaxID=386892 RepID=A0A495IJZ6_9MICO|nr:hypothetical protein [Frondihabitans australicus]RKR76287.1 hypothetical protein C8E83_3454 [Frondihabitans australicus]
MANDFDARLRDVRASAARHRSADVVLIVLTLLLSATVLVPWLLGRFLLRDTLFRPEASSVFDIAIRKNGTYFLSDWTAGLAVLFVFLGLALVLRPWSLRIGRVVFGFLFLAVGAGVFGPVSSHLWSLDEHVSADRLRTTAYPWSDTKYECDEQEAMFSGDLWQAHTARTEGLDGGCDRIVVYKGWEPVGWAQLPHGKTESSLVIQNNGLVQVKDDNGHVITSFAIWKPPIQGASG